ncbi:unnamed protein product [Caenorhabditis angaria]|uniref:RRM domain-containing protein n=1 Tax=Caenorhabditis angaria TaxID=860376 RepID=A0A9P1II89_9PELO|nr:unnamed protein product [Caenorhabditis angaria]
MFKGGPNNERSQRSVFVGNISYDISDENLRAIFSKVGPVLSIKMVHDRESGKPKGYGFIEYPDIQTAESAIRNLNGHELGGRPLRVDSAAGGNNATMEEFNSLHSAPALQEENPYGSEVDPSKAPEVIAKCVTSLAPEKMFELMKQMKDVVRSNPNEIKTMLTTNPQLAYALLQAQVVMRIVDPQVAMAMLHRETPTLIKPFHQIPPQQQQQNLPPMGMPPPQQQQQQPPPFNIPPSTSIPPQQMQHKPPGYGQYQGPPPHAQQQLHAPPPQHMQMAPPSQQFAPPAQQMKKPAPQQQQPDITPEEQQNAELLMQVMQLSEEDLKMLPAGDREKIIELRQQLKRNVK